MADVFDYLKWRGDLSFQRNGFNEVDNLVCASLAYIDYEGVVPQPSNSHGVTLAVAAQKLKAANRLELKGMFLSGYTKLLLQAAQSVRFKDVLLTGYVSEMDNIIPNQFSATVFSISKTVHYIAFRGTDDNLSGWKEDFLMSFRNVVLAQQQAVKYLNTVISQLRGHFYVGGHSKGGNLAVFAAAHTTEKNSKKIIAIFNNDGPGFQPSIFRSEGYIRIAGRIHTFLPQSSFVGMLLEHGTDYKIVASTEKGLLSHIPLTWGVCGASFVYEKELSKSSLQTNEALRTWMGNITLEQREQFVEAFFNVISVSGAQTLSDLSKERLLVIDAMIKKLISLDKETRKILRDTVINFFNIRQRIFRESVGVSIEALLTKKNSE